MKTLTKTILFALSFGSGSAHAALATNAVLTFDAPVFDTNGFVTSGANFGVDFTGDGAISLSERVPLYHLNGLALGTTQAATPGAPDIDSPWQFFGEGGVHSTNSPVTIISDSGTGDVELDFSGWEIVWNSNVIDLGGNAWGSNPDGVAILDCSSDCSAGDTFSLFYTAEVDTGPFTGVRYRFGLDNAPLTLTGNNLASEDTASEDPGVIATGIIGSSATVVPVPAAMWLFGSGLLGLVGVARRKQIA